MNREVTKMLRSRSFGGMPLPASTVRKTDALEAVSSQPRAP
jgi:hypothetical protein